MSGQEINPRGTGGTPPCPCSNLRGARQPLCLRPGFVSGDGAAVRDKGPGLTAGQEEEMDEREEEVQKSNSCSSLSQQMGSKI